jgi:hypothetical protein
MELVVITKPDALYFSVRIHMYEGRCKGEGSLHEVLCQFDVMPLRHPRKGTQGEVRVSNLEFLLHHFQSLADRKP